LANRPADGAAGAGLRPTMIAPDSVVPSAGAGR
jgi:hypothetical protein